MVRRLQQVMMVESQEMIAAALRRPGLFRAGMGLRFLRGFTYPLFICPMEII
jgi:hypothetical protein